MSDKTRILELERALASLLDVVEELTLGLAHGQRPEPEWAELVVSSFAEHRTEIGLLR